MKLTTFLLPLTLGFSANVFGQCTIDQNAFSSPNEYGILPNSATFNGSVQATATELELYGMVFQIHPDVDTVTQLGTFPIESTVIDSIGGLPDGITWSANPVGAITAGLYGCFALDGTPAAGTASGGPNNDGIYPLTVYYTQTWNIFSIPTLMPTELNDYRLQVIDNTNSLSEITGSPLLSVLYDGTSAAASVHSAFTEIVSAELVDVNGKHWQSLSLYPGSNSVKLEQLPAGMYLLQTDLAVARITKL